MDSSDEEETAENNEDRSLQPPFPTQPMTAAKAGPLARPLPAVEKAAGVPPVVAAADYAELEKKYQELMAQMTQLKSDSARPAARASLMTPLPLKRVFTPESEEHSREGNGATATKIPKATSPIEAALALPPKPPAAAAPPLPSATATPATAKVSPPQPKAPEPSPAASAASNPPSASEDGGAVAEGEEALAENFDLSSEAGRPSKRNCDACMYCSVFV